ncbi:MAG: cysteine hydrolase family protein [Methylobacterium frigidaeris]
MTATPHPATALLVVDVQRAFEIWDAEGRRRNNPEALARIAELLAAFRGAGRPVIHVRHAGTSPASHFRPGAPGHGVIEAARERAGEPVLVKRVNSSFIGTDLEERLRAGGIVHPVICGATTNHCVETTARMAGNLGFAPWLVRDATWAYDQTGPDGDHHPAEAVHAMTLANLDGEFARIVRTDEVVASLA